MDYGWYQCDQAEDQPEKGPWAQAVRRKDLGEDKARLTTAANATHPDSHRNEFRFYPGDKGETLHLATVTSLSHRQTHRHTAHSGALTNLLHSIRILRIFSNTPILV